MASEGSRIFVPGLLEGMVCVVSGAGTGLGREAALELARLGATVVGCGRRRGPLGERGGPPPPVGGAPRGGEPLDEMVAATEPLDGRAEVESLDIRDDEAVDALFDG